MNETDLLARASSLADECLKAARGERKAAVTTFIERIEREQPTLAAALRTEWFERGVNRLIKALNEPSAGRTNHTAEDARRPNMQAASDPPSADVVPIRPATPNLPRVSIEALTRANKRLEESILDAIVINGKPLGDYRVHEVADWCKQRAQATGIIQAIIKDLPGQSVLRHAITPADAEKRRLQAATPNLDGYTIDAHKPHGYREI